MSLNLTQYHMDSSILPPMLVCNQPLKLRKVGPIIHLFFNPTIYAQTFLELLQLITMRKDFTN